MITKTANTIANLKNLWIEMFLNKTDRVSNIADGSVLNGVAYGTAKVAQKAIKDIAIVEAQIFPKSATGDYLDKSAALFGVSPRKEALGSSTYVRVFAEPGTHYEVGTKFISKNGVQFTVDQPFTVDKSGYGYISVRSVITGSATNVEANSITEVSPRPLTHIECTNEYAAIGGRDYEDDETFRNRIINYNNKLSTDTMESWTQIFQDLDPRILKVMNVGLGEDGKTHIYLVTQNGSFFTDDELEELLTKATPYFGLTELDLQGNTLGIVIENAKWMYVGGEEGVDFRVELSPNAVIADVRKNIQIAMTKYLDFRFWEAGKKVEWDDLLEVVKTAEGVKYVPDEYFFPYFDEEVPLNMLPRIKGFRMRDLEGNILYDSGSSLSNIFYPAGESDIYKGSQSVIASQKYLCSFTVTNTKNVAVPGAYITIGNKVIITDSNGTANILLENGEYTYILSKTNWTQKTGEFVVLNNPIYININDFIATPYPVTFTVYEGEAPLQGVTVTTSVYTSETDDKGQAVINLEPGTYEYKLEKSGFQTIESVFTVENQPVDIFQRMFLTKMNVNFAVIDRNRSIYIPEANITINDIKEKTDNEGQASMGLQTGKYEMRVAKEDYQDLVKEIEIVGEDPNCILVEMTAIPYAIKFTVLDSATHMVLEGATIKINGSTYLTDKEGIAIISLPNGTYEYTAFKSGYMSVNDFVVVEGSEVSKIVELEQAFYTFRLTVRDIENGNYIQGAELQINGETRVTNVNGVVSVTLGNGDYEYTVTHRNYKRYTGTVTIKDQDVPETIYLELRDTVITYTATDAITKASISGVYIELINKGTGIKVDSGYTNDIGVLQLGAEAGEYTWNATHRYYDAVENQSITLEKLKDIDLPFTMTRREIEPEVDVIENIPGVSGDATTVRFSGENTAETLSNDSYYYIVHTPENFVVPNKGVTFDLMEHVKTFRRAEIGGEDEPYDFASGGAELVFNVSNDEIASLEGTMLTVQPNVTRDAQPRTFYVDVTITTPVSQVTVKIAAEQKAALNFNPVKAGIVVSVKNMFNDNVREYTTNATGKIFPEVMPGIDYQLTIKEKGFYENNGLLIKNWGFGASVPTLMEITCSKKVELRVKQQNTLRPLEGAEITVSGMSLPQTVTSGSDGSASVYISPIAMSYECIVTDHTNKTGTFTPPLSADYIDIIMGYAEMTLTVNLKSMQPYESAAANCTVTVTSAWGGTPSQAYSFTGAANANGVFTSKGNGQFNIPPGEYTITYGGGNSNFNSKTENITLPENITISTTVIRRTISVGYTVKEIIPSISTTAANPVKAGMVLACYYNDNGESSGDNVTTDANGRFVKTVYAGIAERFQIQPVTFYEGNGAVATLNYSDTKTKDLVYTCSKRIPVYITSNLYGELSGASVTFSGMSVNQTGTTNTDGIVQMYISPVNMSYSVSKQHYNTKTGNFKPTGTETRMDIELEAKEYPVTFHVSTQGVLPPDGILVRITNNVLPDMVFEGETNTEGTIVMPNVPVGEYTYEVLAGEVSSDTFSHPQSESGTVLDVEVQYELINAGIQVSEVYGTAGRAYLSNQTITMTSKAGTIKLTLDENGYTNQLLIKGLEYTFTTDSYPNFYSNPTQSYTWTEDGVIWTFDLNVTSKITVNVKDVYVKNNIQGVTVTYNEQVVTTDASGNASLFRSALEKDYSLDKEDYSTVNGIIVPTTASPLNVTMLRNKHVVTINQYEVVPGGDKSGVTFTLTYTSAAGNGEIKSGSNTFEAYLGIPITFTITAEVLRPFYTDYQQSHTFTADGEAWDLNFTCAKQITVNVKDDVPGVNVQGATITYFTQTKTTDVDGNAVFYWSGTNRNISVSERNLESYTGQITYNSANPFNVVMKRVSNLVTLVVKEVVGSNSTPYSNLQIKYTVGSTSGTLTTNENGEVSFDGFIGTEMTFTVVGHPEFYFNATQTHTYTAASQSWTMNLNVSASVIIEVQSNAPKDSLLSGATVKYFNQTGTTNSSGRVEFKRSSVEYTATATATYHQGGSAIIRPSSAGPVFEIELSRSTATVSLTVNETYTGGGTFTYSSMKMNFSPAASTSPLTLDTAGNVSFVCYLGTPVTFTPTTRANYYSNPNTALTYTAAGQVRTIQLICNQKIVINTVANIYNTSNALSGTITYFGQTLASGGSFYRSGLDRQMTATAQYFNNYVGTVTATQTSPYTVTMNRTTRTVTLTVVEKIPNITTTYALSGAVMVRSVPTSSNAPAGEITLDSSGKKSNTVYAGINYTYTPKNNASYYSNASQTHTWTSEGESWLMTLNVTARLTFNIKSSNYGTNISGVTANCFYQNGTTDSSGNFTIYRSGINRTYSFSKTNYNALSGTLSATQASPLNLKMSETSSSITITMKDYYQSAVKGNANGCPVTLTNKSLSSVTFTGTTNSSGQVSFGPMIAGSYTLSWGGGTSYWVAGSTTITMPTATTTQNAVRLTKSVGNVFYFQVPSIGTQFKYWAVNTLMKPVYTTGGVATTVTLSKSGATYYDVGNYTYIAGVTTTVSTAVATYFRTGSSTNTASVYSVTPTYNFNNIPGTISSAPLCSYAIKGIVVTVQNSYTNAAVNGATIKMYGINGSNVVGGAGEGAVQTVTTNSAGQATVYISGLTNRYVVSASRYDTLNTTNTNTANFTLKLVPSNAIITITVKDANTGTSVGSGCVVKLSSNNSSTAYSGTTNTSGQVVLTIKPGNYWWEAGGSTTWGASGTGTWNYPNRSTTAISLIKDQSITIEALKVGVWVDSGGVYSGFVNPLNTFYTGMSTVLANQGYIGSSQAVVVDIPTSVNTNYSLKKILFSFSQIIETGSATNINCSIVSDTSSYAYSQGVSMDTNSVVNLDFLYASHWFEGQFNYTYVIYGVTQRALTAYYCQIRIFKQNGNITQSTYFIQTVDDDDLPYIKSKVNNFCYKNYYVPLVNYGEDLDNSKIFIVTGMDCFKASDYVVTYSIDYQNSPGSYWNRTIAQFDGNTGVSSGAVKRFLFTQSSYELSVLVYGENNAVNGKCHATVISFKGNDWDGLRGPSSVNIFSVYNNFPAAFTDKMGNNMWISSNLKWMFAVLYGTTEKPYGKGLVTVRSVTPIIGKTGWSSTTYYIDDDSTLEIRNAVANKYVLDIIFNSTDYKMIVLCNSLIGSGLDQGQSYTFISPDYLYCFVYNGKKWIELSKESVGMNTLWSRYNNYKTIPGGGTSVDYKPYFNVTSIAGLNTNKNISFVYPGSYSTYKPTAYEFGLTFGD